jgi:hypothetical protein
MDTIGYLLHKRPPTQTNEYTTFLWHLLLTATYHSKEEAAMESADGKLERHPEEKIVFFDWAARLARLFDCLAN